MQRLVIQKFPRRSPFIRLFSINQSSPSLPTPSRNYGLTHVPNGEMLVVQSKDGELRVLNSGYHFLLPFRNKIVFKCSTRVHSYSTVISVPTNDSNVLKFHTSIRYKIRDALVASSNAANLFELFNTHLTQTLSDVVSQSDPTLYTTGPFPNDKVLDILRPIFHDLGLDLTFVACTVDVPIAVQKEKERLLATERRLEEARLRMEALKPSLEALSIQVDAEAKAIARLADEISKPGGKEAAAFRIAERYLEILAMGGSISGSNDPMNIYSSALKSVSFKRGDPVKPVEEFVPEPFPSKPAENSYNSY